MRDVVLLGAALVSTDAFALDVALVHGWSSGGNAPQFVADTLYATGKVTSVSLLDGLRVTPTAVQLASFDAVLLMPDSPFANPAALGTSLAAYVDGGGGVVEIMYSFTGHGYVGDPWVSMGYRPFDGTRPQSSFTGQLVAVLPTHQLLKGVTSFHAANNYRATGITVQPGADLVANWQDDVPLLAAHAPTGAGIVVGINALMHFGTWDLATDGAMLLGNAIEYAATGRVEDRPHMTTAASSCPGTVQIIIDGATGGGAVNLATGQVGGGFTVPGGPCAGTFLPIGRPQLRGQVNADPLGRISLVFQAPQAVCGAPVVAVDTNTCQVSNVGTIPIR